MQQQRTAGVRLSRLAFAGLVGGFYGYVIGYLANNASAVAYHIAAKDFMDADAYLHVGQMVHYRKHEWGLIGSGLGVALGFVVYGVIALGGRWRVVRRSRE